MRFAGRSVQWIIAIGLFYAWCVCMELLVEGQATSNKKPSSDILDSERDDAFPATIIIPGVATFVAFAAARWNEIIPMIDYLSSLFFYSLSMSLFAFLLMFPLAKLSVFVAGPIILAVAKFWPTLPRWLVYIFALPLAIGGGVSIYLLCPPALLAIINWTVLNIVSKWLFVVYEITMKGI